MACLSTRKDSVVDPAHPARVRRRIAPIRAPALSAASFPIKRVEATSDRVKYGGRERNRCQIVEMPLPVHDAQIASLVESSEDLLKKERISSRSRM